MAKITLTALVASAAMLFAAPAFGDEESCLRPADPILPSDGSSLTKAELDAAADAIVEWSDQVRSYTQCLDKVIANREDTTAEEWVSALNQYNSVSVVQTAVWDAYQELAEQWADARAVKTAENTR